MTTPLLPSLLRQTALLLALASAVTACGGDGATEPSTVALSAADRTEAAAAIASPAASTVGGLSPDLTNASVAGAVDGISATVLDQAVTGIALATGAATIPVDRTVTCPAGGTSRVVGSLTGTLAGGGNGSLNAVLLQTFAGCAIVVDGRTLLLSSEGGVAVAGAYAVVNRAPAPQQTLTIAGTVLVAVSGSRVPAVPCVVNLSVVATGATRTTTVTGSFCGSPVNQSFTWTAP